MDPQRLLSLLKYIYYAYRTIPFCLRYIDLEIHIIGHNRTKMICFVEDYSRNISVKYLSEYLQKYTNKGQFLLSPLKVNGYFKLPKQRKRMNNGNKNASLIEAINVMSISTKFQLYPPYGFWGKDFIRSFHKFSSFGCHGKHWNSEVWTKNMFGTGLLKEYSCNTFVRIPAVR